MPSPFMDAPAFKIVCYWALGYFQSFVSTDNASVIIAEHTYAWIYDFI